MHTLIIATAVDGAVNGVVAAARIVAASGRASAAVAALANRTGVDTARVVVVAVGVTRATSRFQNIFTHAGAAAVGGAVAIVVTATGVLTFDQLFENTMKLYTLTNAGTARIFALAVLATAIWIRIVGIDELGVRAHAAFADVGAARVGVVAIASLSATAGRISLFGVVAKPVDAFVKGTRLLVVTLLIGGALVARLADNGV